MLFAADSGWCKQGQIVRLATSRNPTPDSDAFRRSVIFFALGRAGAPRLAGVEIGTELASKRFTAPYKSA
jgi:hypothetical protein